MRRLFWWKGPSTTVSVTNAAGSAHPVEQGTSRWRLGPRIAWRRLALPIGSVLLLFLIWQLIALLIASPRLLPTPLTVGAAMVDEALHGELLFHLGMTLWRVVAAFVVAMLIGTAIGIVMGRTPLVDALGQPWLVFFLNLPALVVIVLAYIWIGLTEAAAITAVALNKIPNVAVTIREGARALDPALLEMAKVFGIPTHRRLRYVILPQLAPYGLAAARSGLALIWKIVLVVELLGRSNGVGFQIALYFQLFDVTHILAYALAFIVIVQAIEWGLIQPLEARMQRWRS